MLSAAQAAFTAPQLADPLQQPESRAPGLSAGCAGAHFLAAFVCSLVSGASLPRSPDSTNLPAPPAICASVLSAFPGVTHHSCVPCALFQPPSLPVHIAAAIYKPRKDGSQVFEVFRLLTLSW